MKKCKKCNLEKDFTEYTVCSANKDGYYHLCKECRYGFKPHKPIQVGNKICKKCKESKDITCFTVINKITKSTQSYCKQCRNKHRHLKRRQDPEKEYLRKRKEVLRDKYNITIEDYNFMYLKQQGKCLICTKYYEKLDIDHCHTTGVVRGLLCGVCNRAIGLFKDSSHNLQRAIEYLKISNTDKS